MDQIRGILFKIGLHEDEVEENLDKFNEDKEKAIVKQKQEQLTKLDFKSKTQKYV